jgi:hypothetical protein
MIIRRRSLRLGNRIIPKYTLSKQPESCNPYPVYKEAKYDIAVGHLLLQSFWANEAIFQLMMLAYNLFLLFNMDFAGETEYRQQIRTFRLKYIFLAGKIIRTARSLVIKLSEKFTIIMVTNLPGPPINVAAACPNPLSPTEENSINPDSSHSLEDS